MTWIGGLVLGIIGSLLAALIAAEVSAWWPRIIDACLHRAVARLPEGRRERLAEEWAAGVSEMPSAFSRLVFVLGLSIAAERLRMRDSKLARLAAASAGSNDRQVISSSLANSAAPLFKRLMHAAFSVVPELISKLRDLSRVLLGFTGLVASIWLGLRLRLARNAFFIIVLGYYFTRLVNYLL